MIENYIVPCLIDRADELKFSDGLLFKLHAELGGVAKIRQYAAQTRLGWHKIDFEHWMYIHKSDELGLVRFIGLLPSDSKPRKLTNTPLPYTKNDFENYVQSLVDSERQRHDSIKDEISLLIHDLRRFSNSIYQNAVATKKALFEGAGEEALIKIENTLAAQAMLSIRTDILDLAESRETQLDEDKVPVYRKFDKVVKSFQPGSLLKRIDLKISGSSHSLILGPDCVEIIAYILIDNAIKYSPTNHSISVEVAEVDGSVDISITSLGPIIGLDEMEAIFEKGFRSKAARDIEASGTGFGLYLARSLVSRFKGAISVEQTGNAITTVKGVYRDTVFRVNFPIYQRLERPVHTHQERKGPAQQLVPPQRRGSKSGTKANAPAQSPLPQASVRKVPPKLPNDPLAVRKEFSKSDQNRDIKRSRWKKRGKSPINSESKK
ncbi:sensor histidine kinase [Paracoccus ravus]|uniref:sensor histidine kinase n=1 Tax=Paracoccus ravus TaxID=2447760 RepID=UPI00106DF529|nr:HAMP domain-containing sensor histidine kinase [Paracoccus ravus]